MSTWAHRKKSSGVAAIWPPAAVFQPVWSDWDPVQYGGLFVSAQLLRPIVCSLFNYRVFLNEALLELSRRCWETAVLKKQTAGCRWADGSDTEKSTYSEHSVPFFLSILAWNSVMWMCVPAAAPAVTRVACKQKKSTSVFCAVLLSGPVDPSFWHQSLLTLKGSKRQESFLLFLMTVFRLHCVPPQPENQMQPFVLGFTSLIFYHFHVPSVPLLQRAFITLTCLCNGMVTWCKGLQSLLCSHMFESL